MIRSLDEAEQRERNKSNTIRYAAAKVVDHFGIVYNSESTRKLSGGYYLIEKLREALVDGI